MAGPTVDVPGVNCRVESVGALGRSDDAAVVPVPRNGPADVAGPELLQRGALDEQAAAEPDLAG